MSRIFSEVPGKKVNRNVFNLSHERKMSMNMGDLIPIFCQEVVPGDTFRVNSEIMLRTAPLLAPIMHRVDIYTHYWYVPYRLLWNEHEKFWTKEGAAQPLLPRIRVTNQLWSELESFIGEVGTLADYMGIPPLPQPAGENYIDISLLPFRAYRKIFEEWYRDQDLDPILEEEDEQMSLESGIFGYDDLPELIRLLSISKRAWEKDYFTSARPWPQKGDEVTLPLTGGQAEVVYDQKGASELNQKWYRADGQNISTASQNAQFVRQGTDMANLFGSGDEAEINMDPNGTLWANLQTIGAATIAEMRRAFQLQKWLERNARSGTRYTEMIRAHFGVKPSDARLQRPEYLGGGRQKLSISEVLQTSESTDNSAMGDMAGHGISMGNSNRFKRFFEEHGVVIGIMSVLPRTAYQQGIPRQFQKFDKFEFYWPEFAHIGEQEIRGSEIFVTGNNASDNETWGYAPRYSEYKYIPSTVHGDFRTTLNHFHMGRIFDSKPALSEDFIKCDATHRVWPVTEQEAQKLWVHIFNNVKAIRPMPVFGEPGLIDH